MLFWLRGVLGPDTPGTCFDLNLHVQRSGLLLLEPCTFYSCLSHPSTLDSKLFVYHTLFNSKTSHEVNIITIRQMGK